MWNGEWVGGGDWGSVWKVEWVEGEGREGVHVEGKRLGAGEG